MGTGKSKESENQITDLDFSLETENLKFVKQVDDIRFGKCKVFKSDKFDHLIAVVRQILQRDSEIELKKIQDSAQELTNLEHDSVIKLLRNTTSKKSEFCSSYWTINLFFEYVNNDLEQDIIRRKKEEIFYDESELWHIIVSVIAALAYLRSRGFEHGDIKPSSILISDQGKVKLLPKPINQSSANMSNYMQAFMGMKKAKYLSPILLKSLELQNQKPQHNCTKSDIFSLGLVILEAALLMEQDDIYDFVSFEINQSILNNKLEYVKDKYSPQLQQFLQHMLIFDEMDRPDVDILFAYIEDLCRQGIQMSDRIFSLGQKDRQPTYNYTHEDQQNVSQDYYDIKNDKGESSVKKNAKIFQTPIKDNFSHDLGKDGSNQALNRQEIVRRSNWTLDENTDNNIYLGSTNTQVNPVYDASNIGTKQYTFSDSSSNIQKQYTFGSFGIGGMSSTPAPLTNTYTPLTSTDPLKIGTSSTRASNLNYDYSSLNTGLGTAEVSTNALPSAYVPMLIKDNNYTSTTSATPITTTYYSSTLPQTTYNKDINNLDSINKIIQKYSKY